MPALKVAFLGTAAFAVPSLDALVAAGHDVRAVYTAPARPAGRGKRPRPSAVEQAARAHDLAVRTPIGLRDADEQAAFAALRLDAAVVVAYGLILPAAILEAPRLGCINLHASLLPRWRGAAPIQRAIMAGDRETGVTAMLMDEGLDTGPMLLRQSVPIGPADTAGDLHDRLAAIGAPLLPRALDGLADGSLEPEPQPEAGVTYAKKIEKAEAAIDWHRPATDLVHRIHGLSPFPGAWFALDGARVKIHRAEAISTAGPAGTVIDDRLTIACGEGALRPLIVQRDGKAAMPTATFLRGHPVPTATVLG